MKLGDVLRKEREMRGIGAQRFEEVWTDMRPLSAQQIQDIESGENDPCGLPFQELDDYEYRTAS